MRSSSPIDISARFSTPMEIFAENYAVLRISAENSAEKNAEKKIENVNFKILKKFGILSSPNSLRLRFRSNKKHVS